jgi:uncharacterized protein
VEHRRTRFGWTVRLDPGEEIVAALAEFAGREHVRAGEVTGIGSVSEAELGYFVRSTGQYVRRRFAGGDSEIGSLTGNFSELDGRPFLHAHVVIAGPDWAAHAGHLLSAIIAVTGEFQIVSDPDPQRRRKDPERGFHPLELR